MPAATSPAGATSSSSPPTSTTITHSGPMLVPCSRFFDRCENRGLSLTAIRPFDVAALVKEQQEKHEFQRRRPLWGKFAVDSPLEEAVTSEPVSVENSLLAANLQGISLDSATLGHFRCPKTYANPSPYGANSLRIRAGNFYDVAGNSIGQSGKVAVGSGILLCPSRLSW